MDEDDDIEDLRGGLWDTGYNPQGEGDIETDSSPERFLLIARDVWRLFAPDPADLAARGQLRAHERAGILFWLAPLERLVRCVLFLLLPDEVLRTLTSREEEPVRAPTAPPTPPRATAAPPPSTLASAPRSPAFRYFSAHSFPEDLELDPNDPDALAKLDAWLAARRRPARSPGAPSIAPEDRLHSAAPIARRLAALLDVLNDPLRHADRLRTRLNRSSGPFDFTPREPVRITTGPPAPCASALMRALWRCAERARPVLPELSGVNEEAHWSSG